MNVGWEEKFQRANRLYEDRDYLGAFNILSSLQEVLPEEPKVLRLLQRTAVKLRMLDLAIAVGKTLTERFIDSEFDSVCLFLAYYYSADLSAAFRELKRLVMIGDSPEYLSMAKDQIENLSQTGHWRDREFSAAALELFQAALAFMEECSEWEERRQLTNLIGVAPPDFRRPT